MKIGMACLAAVAGLTLSGAAITDDRRHDHDAELKFQASLVGEQEVTPPAAPTTPTPGVVTETSASVRVKFSKDLSSFSYLLVVRNGLLVTQAHLHCGRPGQNGPVVVFLAPLTGGADVNGVLGSG